jgi:hypothetical protein
MRTSLSSALAASIHTPSQGARNDLVRAAALKIGQIPKKIGQ